MKRHGGTQRTHEKAVCLEEKARENLKEKKVLNHHRTDIENVESEIR